MLIVGGEPFNVGNLGIEGMWRTAYCTSGNYQKYINLSLKVCGKPLKCRGSVKIYAQKCLQTPAE